MAKWSARYKDRLPDSAFVGVRFGLGRKLPVYNHLGNLSMSHVDNALARANQVDGMTAAKLKKVKAYLRRLQMKKNPWTDYDKWRKGDRNFWHKGTRDAGEFEVSYELVQDSGPYGTGGQAWQVYRQPIGFSRMEAIEYDYHDKLEDAKASVDDFIARYRHEKEEYKDWKPTQATPHDPYGNRKNPAGHGVNEDTLYDDLMLMAENEGAFYPHDAAGAVEKAWRDWSRTDSSSHRHDYRAIKAKLIADLHYAWNQAGADFEAEQQAAWEQDMRERGIRNPKEMSQRQWIQFNTDPIGKTYRGTFKKVAEDFTRGGAWEVLRDIHPLKEGEVVAARSMFHTASAPGRRTKTGNPAAKYPPPPPFKHPKDFVMPNGWKAVHGPFGEGAVAFFEKELGGDLFEVAKEPPPQGKGPKPWMLHALWGPGEEEPWKFVKDFRGPTEAMSYADKEFGKTGNPGNRYDAAEWVYFMSDPYEPTSDMIVLSRTFTKKVSDFVADWMEENGYEGEYDEDTLAFHTYGSIVGAGFGLWEGGVLGEEHSDKVEAAILADNTLTSIGQQIDDAISMLDDDDGGYEPNPRSRAGRTKNAMQLRRPCCDDNKAPDKKGCCEDTNEESEEAYTYYKARQAQTNIHPREPC